MPDIADNKNKPFFDTFVRYQTGGIADYLDEHPDLFDEYPFRTAYADSVHREASDIWVRYNHPSNLDKEGFNGPHFPVWYHSAYKIPFVFDICIDLMAQVCGEHLGGVLITRLPPGGKVYEHADSGWHAEFYEKFLVPIRNPKGAKFIFGDEYIEPEDGHVFWFNNQIPHSVDNSSFETRYAMIICIRTARQAFHGLH